jgi:hypothetical protein
MEQLNQPCLDPTLVADQKEALTCLLTDLRRLPPRQQSALSMRALDGLAYIEIADALGTSVPAVKSLLVRARTGLVKATEARNVGCSQIRAALVLAHQHRVRPGPLARRHVRDCAACREFRRTLRERRSVYERRRYWEVSDLLNEATWDGDERSCS